MKAEKREAFVKQIDFDYDFIKGIREIFNEDPK